MISVKRISRIKPARLVRWAVMAAGSAFFLFFSRFISEHAICPIGGFEMFFTGIFNTGFSLAGLFSGMVLIFLIMSVFSILFRRAYCGYICPLGAVQELFEKTGKRILPRKFRTLRIPDRADRILRWLKYPVLGLFVLGAAVWGGHWMISADPFIVLMGLFKGSGIAGIVQRNLSSLLFFAGILVFAFFLGRGFCRYLCPAGAWYALLSKLSPSKIIRNTEKCAGCGLCTKACPMHLDVADLEKVKSAECIGCQECVAACPTPGALEMKAGGMGIPSALVPVAAAAVFSGSVWLAAVSMPVRGERPQGAPEGQEQEAGQGSGIPGSSDRVGLGGCSDCNGCGFCGLLT